MSMTIRLMIRQVLVGNQLYLGRQRELCELPVLGVIRNHVWSSFMMFLEHLEQLGAFQAEKTATAALLPPWTPVHRLSIFFR